MTTPFKAVLQRLKRSRPKLSEEALVEFLMTAKSMSIADILAAVREISGSKANAPEVTDTEKAVKKRLREVGGRATDFLPYLEEALNEKALGSNGRTIQFPKKTTLGQAIATSDDLLGAKSHDVVLAALEKFVADNDTSYKFKSA